MKEIWATVPGYERYQVSDLGNIRSSKGLLKPCVDYRGYRVVQLSPGKKTIKVARLVLEAFVDSKHGFEVDHINRLRGDDRLENLRWCTRKQNVANRGRFTSSSSGGVPGVSWYKKSKKWRAFKKIDGVLYHIGYFFSVEEAEKAVNNFLRSRQ